MRPQGASCFVWIFDRRIEAALAPSGASDVLRTFLLLRVQADAGPNHAWSRIAEERVCGGWCVKDLDGPVTSGPSNSLFCSAVVELFPGPWGAPNDLCACMFSHRLVAPFFFWSTCQPLPFLCAWYTHYRRDEIRRRPTHTPTAICRGRRRMKGPGQPAGKPLGVHIALGVYYVRRRPPSARIMPSAYGITKNLPPIRRGQCRRHSSIELRFFGYILCFIYFILLISVQFNVFEILFFI